MSERPILSERELEQLLAEAHWGRNHAAPCLRKYQIIDLFIDLVF